jgi:hypothetical protein
MRAKLVNEDIKNILRPKKLSSIKDEIISSIDTLISDFSIFIHSSKVFRSGKGRMVLQKFLENLPKEVKAGPNFYYDTKGYSSFDKITNILRNVYGIKTLNINPVMGTTINVPFIKDTVKIKADYGTRVYSLYFYLPKQKIILEFRLDKRGSCIGTVPDKIWFDYDHLKKTLEDEG